MSHFISRLQIARNPSADALKMLIDPNNRDLAMDAHHRLIWSAFAGEPAAKRDFLWRAEGKGRFIVLSNRQPEPSPLFEPYEVKSFAPQLSAGQALQFVLRVNATKTRPEKFAIKPNGKKGDSRVDIVMDVLKDIPAGQERATQRMEIANQAAEKWMTGQGEKYGFALLKCTVADYSVHALPSHRGMRKGQPQFGVLELSGTLSVTNPVAFVEKLTSGFGRAKAFGCGLMLVKRA
jgi:CRISPR system Cascade subunit CasE